MVDSESFYKPEWTDFLTFQCSQGDYQVLQHCFTGTLLKISSAHVGTVCDVVKGTFPEIAVKIMVILQTK